MLAQPGITAPIIGASKMSHLDDAVEGARHQARRRRDEGADRALPAAEDPRPQLLIRALPWRVGASSSTPIPGRTTPSPSCWRSPRRMISRCSASSPSPATCRSPTPNGTRGGIVELAGRTDVPVYAGVRAAAGASAAASPPSMCTGRPASTATRLPEPVMPLGAEHGVDFHRRHAHGGAGGSISRSARSGPLTNVAMALGQGAGHRAAGSARS